MCNNITWKSPLTHLHCCPVLIMLTQQNPLGQHMDHQEVL